MSIRLGCIADDFTGATDLANNLVRAGMRVVQTINVPAADTVVDALRTVAAGGMVLGLLAQGMPGFLAASASPPNKPTSASHAIDDSHCRAAGNTTPPPNAIIDDNDESIVCLSRSALRCVDRAPPP